MRVTILYGALRSGTTLLRLMLNGHPKLWVPGESDFLFDYLSQEGGRPVLDQDRLSRDWICAFHLSQIPSEGDAFTRVRKMVADIAEGRDHITLVLHRGIKWAVQLFPDANIVHLVRDPRDVARSCIGMGWQATAYYGVTGWLWTEQEWNHVVPTIPAGRSIDIRYEDLVRQPKECLSRIAEHLGVSYHEGFMRYPESSTYGPLDASLCFQWKTKMTARDASLVEGVVGKMLVDHGYEPSAEGPVLPGFFEKQWLRVSNFLGRWRAQTRLFGFWDPLIYAFSRRLRLRKLASAAERRINKKKATPRIIRIGEK